MSSFRLGVASILLMCTTGCSSNYSSATSPTPSPSTVPAPSGPLSSVSVPIGASALTTNAFNPDVADVAAGTTVTWTNTDSVSHTSTSDGATWNSGTVAPGGRFSFTFQKTGTFSYHCAIHPGMVGTVVVHSRLRWGRKWLQGEDYSFLVKPTRQSRESGGTQLSTLNKTDLTSLGGHEKYTAAQLDWSDVPRFHERETRYRSLRWGDTSGLLTLAHRVPTVGFKSDRRGRGARLRWQ